MHKNEINYMLPVTVIGNTKMSDFMLLKILPKNKLILVFLSFLLFSKLVLASEYNTYINTEWEIISSENLNDSGMKISQNNYVTENWINTDIPKTVLAALVDNGIYKNIFFGKNFEEIPNEQFLTPWWYRKEFVINEKDVDDNFIIIFEGINYKANIWLNGKLISTDKIVEGAFGIFEFDITNNVITGKNVIAVEVIPPKTGDLTIGFVDWNPSPPDKNMGLWRGVKLKRSGKISVKNTFVKSKIDIKTLDKAYLSITSELKNNSKKLISGKLNYKIGDIKFSKDFKLNSFESKSVLIDFKNNENLIIENPKLWWPNNLGEPNLYNLQVKVIIDNKISDEENIRFGIREVEDYINENGYRGYKINGKKLVIEGAGWVDDILLNDSDEKVINQIKYAKHLNLNTIRLEGFWGKNKTLYDAADENGILLMVGWSCQWEWEGYCGRKETEYMCIDTPRDIEIQSNAFMDQVKWLRNNPSIFVWVYGSDKLPSPELEKKLNDLMKIYDSTRPTLATCKGIGADGEGNLSVVSGNPGVKMLGPYEYVTPNYWYLDTKNGGAYGFNTETGPGAQVPPIESIKK